MFYCIFAQINTALVNIWDFFKKHEKSQSEREEKYAYTQ